MSRTAELIRTSPSEELTVTVSVAKGTWETSLDEPNPDSTVDESRVVVVDNNSGGIKRGGSHRSQPGRREGSGCKEEEKAESSSLATVAVLIASVGRSGAGSFHSPDHQCTLERRARKSQQQRRLPCVWDLRRYTQEE